MSSLSSIGQLVRNLESSQSPNFEKLALTVFQKQARENSLYRKYLELIHINPVNVNKVKEIPFLPIQFFKSYKIKTGEWLAEDIFTSSGTTGSQNSQHFVKSKADYLQNCIKGFEYHYGAIDQYCVLALLPAYLERTGSSLVVMTDEMIQLSVDKNLSGFYLNQYDDLIEKLKYCQLNNIPTVLLGVSFALWDLAERKAIDFPGLIVMETGGMKGRRKEITRKELHAIYKEGFGVEKIHSEYGMTELMSQAYSKGEGLFNTTPSMRISTRQITDPLALQDIGKTGAINIIDLANYHTISFIATDDLGKVYEDGSFEVLGRMDNSDIRGCNLMVE
ncbi:MAG: acyl transferase [Bacteroidota bacterium]